MKRIGSNANLLRPDGIAQFIGLLLGVCFYLFGNQYACASGNVVVVKSGEGITQAEVSESAINRIHCSTEVSGVVYPQERSVDVKAMGQDVYVRFNVSGIKLQPGTVIAPLETYIYCGKESFGLSLVPVKEHIPSTIVLKSSGPSDREKAKNYEQGVSYERAVVELTKAAYKETPPAFYEVRAVNKPLGSFIGADAIKMFDWLGDRFAVSIFSVTNMSSNDMNFIEPQFLNLERKPLAVSLTHQLLQPGESMRVIIVRNRVEE